MFRKLISLVVVVVMTTTFLAGCKTNNTTNVEESTSTDQQTSADTIAKEDATEEEFTISIASTSLGDAEDVDPDNLVAKNTREYVEKTIKEKYPSVKIEWYNLGSEKYNDLFKAKNASGTLEDVVQLNVANPKAYMKAGVLADLSDSPWIENAVDAAKDSCMYQGKWYASPLDVAVYGIYYNKKIFDEVGTTPPDTWSELLDVCEKIKAKGIDPFVGGFKDNWVLEMTYGMLVTTFVQDKIPNPSLEVYDGKITLDGPEYKKPLDKLDELFKNGYFNKDCLSIGWDQSRPYWVSGKAAMLAQGSWLPGMIASMDKTFEMGFFAFPNDDGTQPLRAGASAWWSVNAKSAHLDAAKEIVNIMASKECVRIRLKNQGICAFKDYDVEYNIAVVKEISNMLNTAKLVVKYFNEYIPTSASQKISSEALTKIAAGQPLGNEMVDAQKLFNQDKSTVVPPEN